MTVQQQSDSEDEKLFGTDRNVLDFKLDVIKVACQSLEKLKKQQVPSKADINTILCMLQKEMKLLSMHQELVELRKQRRKERQSRISAERKIICHRKASNRRRTVKKSSPDDDNVDGLVSQLEHVLLTDHVDHNTIPVAKSASRYRESKLPPVPKFPKRRAAEKVKRKRKPLHNNYPRAREANGATLQSSNQYPSPVMFDESGRPYYYDPVSETTKWCVLEQPSAIDYLLQESDLDSLAFGDTRLEEDLD